MNKERLIHFLEKIDACGTAVDEVKVCKDLKSLYNYINDGENLVWLISRIEPDRRKFIALLYDIIIEASAYKIREEDNEAIKVIEEYIKTGYLEYTESEYKYPDDCPTIFKWLINKMYGHPYHIFMDYINEDTMLCIVKEKYSYRRLQFLLNKMV